MTKKRETALRARRRRLQQARLPIPHLEKWIADGGCAPKAFIFDQYGHPVHFNMTTKAGRDRALAHLPPGQAADELGAWENEQEQEVETTPLWQLGVAVVGIVAAVWMSARTAL